MTNRPTEPVFRAKAPPIDTSRTTTVPVEIIICPTL